MPIKNSQQNNPDRFALNQEEVTDIILNYLTKQGEIKKLKSIPGIDIKAKINNKYIIVKSRGSQAMSHDANTVFDGSQIRIHVAEQVEKIMRVQQELAGENLYIIANPDIPRIRTIVDQISIGLDKLSIIRLWVKPTGVSDIEIPHNVISLANEVGIKRDGLL